MVFAKYFLLLTSYFAAAKVHSGTAHFGMAVDWHKALWYFGTAHFGMAVDWHKASEVYFVSVVVPVAEELPVEFVAALQVAQRVVSEVELQAEFEVEFAAEPVALNWAIVPADCIGECFVPVDYSLG